MAEDKSHIGVLSTKGQLEDFMENNFVWKDIQRELIIWLEGFEKEKDGIVDDAADSNPSTAAVLMHLGDLNGRKKAIKYVLTLPQLFLNILEEKENESSSE
jgi:hypothetical protein